LEDEKITFFRKIDRIAANTGTWKLLRPGPKILLGWVVNPINVTPVFGLWTTEKNHSMECDSIILGVK